MRYVLLGCASPGFLGEDDGLGAVAEVELEQARDVVMTVAWLMTSVVAIWLFDGPRSTWDRTSSSRGMSGASRSGRGPSAGVRLTCCWLSRAGDRRCYRPAHAAMFLRRSHARSAFGVPTVDDVVKMFASRTYSRRPLRVICASAL